MDDLYERISRSDKYDIEQLLKAVLKRYAQLYPDWEVSIISLHRGTEWNDQLDRMIAVLESMKRQSFTNY